MNDETMTNENTMIACEWYTSDIRWVDKLSLTSDGDIIDFYGQVVGHIKEVK